MTQQIGTVVRRTITVAASQRRAFDVFTTQLGSWWPKEFHIGESDMADFVLEPEVGGRRCEVGVDEEECHTRRAWRFEHTALASMPSAEVWIVRKAGPTAWSCSRGKRLPAGCSKPA